MHEEGDQEASEQMLSGKQHHIQLYIAPSGVIRLLLIVITVLTLANFVAIAAVRMIDWAPLTKESDIIQLFAFDYERNLPTWYQGMSLAICGVLLLLIGMGHRKQKQKRFSRYWISLAVIFFGLSFDEMVSIHEQWIVPVRSLLGISGGLLYFAWVIPATALLVLLAITLIPFLRSLPTSTRLQFLIAGMIFIAGTIGMEVVSGAYVSGGDRGDTIQYQMLTTVEELLEMIGIVLFLRAVLAYMADGDNTIRFS